MIQRIQSLFLFGAIVILAIVSFSGSFFTVITDTAINEFTAFGISSYTHDKQHLIEQQNLPVYIFTLTLLVFAGWVLFSYKKLGQQLKMARILWGVYLLTVIAVVVWNSFLAKNQVKGEVTQSNYGSAFYFLVIGIAFVHLAFMGIRKDKSTIDSLNRLR